MRFTASNNVLHFFLLTFFGGFVYPDILFQLLSVPKILSHTSLTLNDFSTEQNSSIFSTLNKVYGKGGIGESIIKNIFLFS